MNSTAEFIKEKPQQKEQKKKEQLAKHKNVSNLCEAVK